MCMYARLEHGDGIETGHATFTRITGIPPFLLTCLDLFFPFILYIYIYISYIHKHPIYSTTINPRPNRASTTRTTWRKMKHLAPILGLVLASSAAAYLPFHTPQRPLQVNTLNDASQESYDGHQVWRLDWTDMEEGTKSSLRDVIDVSHH